MPRQRVRENQVKKPDSFDDQLTPSEIANSESTSSALEDFFDAVLSQLRRILGTANWHDAIPISLTALEAVLALDVVTEDDDGIAPAMGASADGSVLVNDGDDTPVWRRLSDADLDIDITIEDGSLALAKLANATQASLLGATAVGPFGEITLGASMAFVGGALVRAALTGDVTASANSNATTIANDAVTSAKILDHAITYAKLQNFTNPAGGLVGNADGSSNMQEIYLGTSMLFGPGNMLMRAALTGDVTTATDGVATTIANNAVSNAKLRDSAALSVIGRASSSSGDPADIAAGSDGDVLRRSGTTLGFGAIPESSVTNLVNDLAAKVPTSRTVGTTAPLTGGGALSGDLTIAISNFTGDSGAGGAKGAVPAPSAGDAAASKFLKADGTWAVAGSHSPGARFGDGTSPESLFVGQIWYVRVPYSGTIAQWDIVADIACTCVLDVWKATTRPTSSAQSITASAKPQLSNSELGESTDLTGWSTTVTAGDILAFRLDSLSGSPSQIVLTLRIL